MVAGDCELSNSTGWQRSYLSRSSRMHDCFPGTLFQIKKAGSIWECKCLILYRNKPTNVVPCSSRNSQHCRTMDGTSDVLSQAYLYVSSNDWPKIPKQKKTVLFSWNLGRSYHRQIDCRPFSLMRSANNHVLFSIQSIRNAIALVKKRVWKLLDSIEFIFYYLHWFQWYNPKVLQNQWLKYSVRAWCNLRTVCQLWMPRTEALYPNRWYSIVDATSVVRII